MVLTREEWERIIFALGIYVETLRLNDGREGMMRAVQDLQDKIERGLAAW